MKWQVSSSHDFKSQTLPASTCRSLSLSPLSLSNFLKALVWEKESGASMGEQKEEVTEKSVAAVSRTVVVWMILGSVIGGLLLGWWELKFHYDYEQLWMVPFGLILLVTPIIAFSSVVISGVCCIPADAVHSLEDDPET